MSQDTQSVEEKIVAAAVECIERYGINGTTNRRIAALAGVNSAAINYYFRSKEILVQRCMQVTLENAFGEHEFDDLPEGPAAERMEAMFDHLIEGGCQYPGITRAHFYELITEGNYSSLAVTKINEYVERLVGDLTAHGANPADGQLRLACAQIASAAFMMILAPRLFERSFGLDMADEPARKAFIHRLIDRLLV
jgi:AcrR family transcriptional regulator